MIAVLIALLIVAILAVVIFIVSYNGMCKASVRVDNSWSQIDVQLKKRYDLIPNLLKTVKGYVDFEVKTLEEIVALRNKAGIALTADEKINMNNELAKSINNMMFTAENYSDLKADENFIILQSELRDIETKIATSRQFYNDTVMKYNEKIIKFPTNLIAVKLGYNQRPYFTAQEDAEKAPNIKF